MAGRSRKKPYAQLIIFGIAAFALYAALLMQQSVITEWFSKGGMYAFLPLIAAFAFSFVHGNFTSHFWTVLGVEASKKKEVK